MRVAIITLLVSIFFTGITYYFFTEVSPFNESKLEEIIEANELQPGEEEKLFFELEFIIERGLVVEYLSVNGYIGLGTFILSVSLFFYTVHLIVDKLFFKNLIESPDYKLALRRSIEFAAAFLFFIFLKLKGIDVEVALLTFVIMTGADMFIDSNVKARQKESQVNRVPLTPALD